LEEEKRRMILILILKMRTMKRKRTSVFSPEQVAP
jgi:hypothetical protein